MHFIHLENIKQKNFKQSTEASLCRSQLGGVAWKKKKVGILTGREEQLASQLPFPSLSG